MSVRAPLSHSVDRSSHLPPPLLCNPHPHQLLANLLLWAVFVPLSARKSNVLGGAGAAGFVLQLALVPLGHLVQREAAGAATWRDGSAFYYVVAGALGTRAPLAGWAAARPAFCRLLSYALLASEAAFPFGLALTDHQRPARAWLVAATAGAHLIFYVAVLNFPQWAALWIAALLALCPTPTLDRILGPHRRSTDAAQTKINAEPAAACRSSPSPLQADSLRRRKQPLSTDVSERRRQTPLPDPSPLTAVDGIATRVASYLWELPALALLLFMLCDAGSRDAGAYPALDDGAVARNTGFRQGWPLFRDPSPETQQGWASMIARVPRRESQEVMEAGALQADVFTALQDGKWSRNVTSAGELASLERRPACPSCRYPSWRYERFYHASALKPFPEVTTRTTQLTKHYCGMLRDHFQGGAGEAAAAAAGVVWRNAAIHFRLGRYTVDEPPRAALGFSQLLNWSMTYPPTYSEGITLIDVIRLC